MKYALVATTSYLLLVDLQSKQVFPLENERPEYYGISWFSGSSNLVLSHSGQNNADLIDISQYALSEQGWISAGGEKSKSFLSAPHQIICAPDGRVVCTNTGRNVITVLGFDQPNVFQEGGISGARWDRLALDQVIGDHLNSVFLCDDKLFVIAHGHHKGSRLAIFSYPDLCLLSVESLGAKTGLHNIWVTPDGQRISCHSETGSLVDLDAVQPLWHSGSPIYTRGLAASRDHVVVGESQKTERHLRRSSLSGLWILDRRTWQSIDYLCLGPYGAVNEVRLLDVIDEAHHGHPFSNVELLLKQNMLTRVAELRLQSAIEHHRGGLVWAAYEWILGSPKVLADGSKEASSNNLCLALWKPDSTEAAFAFEYVLSETQGGHVSVVLGYSGSGGDTHMTALLVQSAGQEAMLSAWCQNGTSWARMPNIAVSDIPRAGRIQIFACELAVRILVDQKEVINLSASELGLQRCNEKLGIRWIGATVKPVVE